MPGEEECPGCGQSLEGHCSNCGECACDGWCDDCGEYRCEPECECDEWAES